MLTMKRFDDSTLLGILRSMRMQGGSKLSRDEWQALLATEISVPQLEHDPEAFLKETAGWFESSYLWSVVTMASYSRAIISARQQQQVRQGLRTQ